MNSALKPVLSQPGVVQSSGQASPAKANVANVNHAVGHPQGAQNSLHHGSNNLVVQNLTHHAPPPQLPPYAAPSMAPITANMAQMAQNMSHHGNLSHLTQNSVPTPTLAPSPSKTAPTTPLSLVQDKPSTPNTSQPLALTRTSEKKEPDSTVQSNGTIESSKSATSTSTILKAQNLEPIKEKQDIAKTSPSTPKPPEKPSGAPSTPQKSEPAIPVTQADGPIQPKAATATEAPEKSPSKPTEIKPSQAADVAPRQTDNKPEPESAKDSQVQEMPTTPAKLDIPPAQSPKTENKPEEQQKASEPEPQVKVDKLQTLPPPSEQPTDKKEETKVGVPKKEETEKQDKTKEEEKIEEKKPVKIEPKPKSTLKLATVTPPMRKRRQTSLPKSEGLSSAKKAHDDSTPDTRTKRNRTKVQLYQSPTPELAMATKLSASAGRSTPTKPNDDKLIVFYKNEYLAVRNAEGGFYVCQTTQNVYRTTRKIKIRWLSQDKSLDPTGETYKPDFYDVTDMECVLTTLSLSRAPSGGGAQILRQEEHARATSILARALRAEQSGADLQLTEEHPDGLDLSLYTDESQLEKKSRKRNSSKSSPRSKHDDDDETAKETPPSAKRARTTPKRSPKTKQKAKSQPIKQTNNNKQKSAGSTPLAAPSSKTATAVTEKAKAKTTPAKRIQAKSKADSPSTPLRQGRRSAKDVKTSPIVPTPSTSTGKSTRTPRKPPAHK